MKANLWDYGSQRCWEIDTVECLILDYFANRRNRAHRRTRYFKMRDNQLSDFRRNEMGFIFQSFNLIDTLNVKDNILLPLAVEKFH